MGESRHENQSFYRIRRAPLWFRVIVLLLTGGFLWRIHYIVFESSYTISQKWVILILIGAVLLWVTEAIPPFAVSLLILASLVFTLGNPYLNEQWADMSPYLNTWSSPIIWILLGGFFMAKGLSKTGLDQKFLSQALRIFGKKPDMVLLGVMLTTAVASMLLSNTSTTAMMLGAITPLVMQIGKDAPLSRGLILGIPVAAAIGGMGTLIGSPPNAIAAGALTERGINMDFARWMLFGIPVSLGLVWLFWKALLRKYTPKVKEAVIAFQLPTETEDSTRERNTTLVAVVLTILLWLTTPVHGIPIVIISVLPIAILTSGGVVNALDVRSIPWDTLLLVAGGLALGTALKESGLVDVFVSQIEFLQRLPFQFLILISLGYLTVLMSSFMSNTATTALLVPVGISLVPSTMVEVTVIIALCASAAVLLPVSSPPIAIAYASGWVEQKEFRYGGILLGIGGPILILVWTLLLGWLL